MTTYSVGYGQARILERLATEPAEREAVARLEDFNGTAEDVRVAASLHLRRGERHQAAELLRLLPPEA